MHRLGIAIAAQSVSFVIVAAVSLGLHGEVRGEMVGTGVLCTLVCEQAIAEMRRRYGSRLRALNAQLEQRIAERTAALEREIHERRELLALAAAAVHEINNPLGALIGYLEEANDLLPSGAPPGELHAAVAGALAAAGQVRDVTGALQQLARPEPAAPEPVAVADAVGAAVQLAAPHLRQRCHVATELAPELPRVHASRARLTQVLLNLLINAAKAARPDADNFVTVRAAPDPGGTGVRIDVADTGRGIAPELRERLFEPFATGRADAGGSGLGLFVCRSIVEGYGGTIAVASTPGQGATFTIRLPSVSALTR